MINNQTDSQRARRSDTYLDWYEEFHRTHTENHHYCQDIDKILYLWLENWKKQYPELNSIIDSRKTLVYCLFEVKTSWEQLTNDQRQVSIDRASELDCPAFTITNNALSSSEPYLLVKPLNELGMSYNSGDMKCAFIPVDSWPDFLDRLIHDRIKRYIKYRR